MLEKKLTVSQRVVKMNDTQTVHDVTYDLAKID